MISLRTQLTPIVRSGTLTDFLKAVIPPVVLWGYITAAIFGSFAKPIGEFDDAIPLIHGALVQQGRTPNLDFYSFYPPLGLYVNAAAFKLVGRTVIATRAVAALLYLATILVLWRLLRLVMGRSSVSPLLVLLVGASIGAAINLPSWPGLAMSIIALAAYLCAHYQGRARLLLIGFSGVLTALTLLYRINFGMYVAAVVAVDLLLGWWPIGRRRWQPDCLKESLIVPGLAFGIPMVLCCAGICLAIYGRNFGLAISEFTGTAQRMMARWGFLALPVAFRTVVAVMLPPAWFAFHTLLRGKPAIQPKSLLTLALAFGLPLVALVGRSRVSIAVILPLLEVLSVVLLQLSVHRLQRVQICWVLFFCFQLHYFLSRADWSHWRYVPFLSAILFVFFVYISFAKPENESGVYLPRGTAIAALLGALLLLLLQAQFKLSPARSFAGAKVLASVVRHPNLSDTDRILGSAEVEPAWRMIYPDTSDFRAVQYVRGVSANTDPIFVGVQDHSTVAFNTLRVYWLSGRPIGSRRFQLEGGITTAPEVQQEIVEDLLRNNVRWLIIDRDQPGLPPGSRPYVGSKILDQYISKKFSEQVQFGRFAVWHRN